MNRPAQRVDNQACLAFQNSYAQLPERFFARLPPAPVSSPRFLAWNHKLADDLGLDSISAESDETLAVFAGNSLPASATPLALVYAGHQFGNFVPQLGDGRAHLLGEILDRSGARRDIQLKGSGPTPFSRGGDGRAALGPVLREYLLAEAMHALGIPTTRALAAVATGDKIMREGPLPGAILTRVAASHIRVGTFEYFAARRDISGLRTLLSYSIDRHFPEVARDEVPALALLQGVMHRQAHLVAQWMRVGFVHGVMNTDNTTISGETIDYGPCAFMDAYDPSTVFSSIDRFGRYAYGAQPSIIAWNMSRLALALAPLVDSNPEVAVARLQEAMDGFQELMSTAWLAMMRQKLGLTTARDDDDELVSSLFEAMHGESADFTNTFRALSAAADDDTADAAVRALFKNPAACDSWLPVWRARLAYEPRCAGDRMRQVNPAFIPRNHRVEHALEAAMSGDMAPFQRLASVLTQPYVDRPELAEYAEPSPPSDTPYRTFCGT